MRYAELRCKTNFSFLEGASHANELVDRAAALGYAALAVTDRNTLAGIVRAWGAAKEAGLPLVTGAELQFTDGPVVVAWAMDRRGYGGLCRLLTLGRTRGTKGNCLLHWRDLHEHGESLLVGLVLDDRQVEEKQRQSADELRETFADRAYLLVDLQCGPDDRGRLESMERFAQQVHLPLVATGNVLYHHPERLLAQDCLTAIRLGTTVDQLADARLPNSQRHLRTLAEIAHTFRSYPEALERSCEVAARAKFRLDELKYEYPRELAPEGRTAIEYLKQLTWEGAKKRYPTGVPQRVIEILRHELSLIEELQYEAYFLTVWDLVRYARERGILCQGRGSAANSVVCYCLGVTSVDPERTELLFERFISRQRNEAPDIDVDFEHQRREEVLQYIYQKYGRDRAGMTATVIRYRTKGAIRDVGKALGISAEQLQRLSKWTEGYHRDPNLPDRCRQVGLAPDSELGKRFLYLVETLIGFPRHLSQHVGGMVMTEGRLCELCPIENAAMPGRTVIQWDKDDLDELGILKVDCLSLGMLSAIRRCFEMVARNHGRVLTLANIPEGDPATYDMICKADTVGVFQIESRAQMSMLPRLRPRCFYDLVIEVAIVRPGPIQGQMVHPYLRARSDPSSVVYPNEAIKQVLEKTLGIPLFQEQAMRLAVVAAGFTPGEADQLRRAMAAWRRPGVIDRFREKLMQGMRQRGLTEEFAEQVFRQIRGFGEYGFPESHAASFALLVYASAYLKCHYPAEFYASILNSQPMGFYAPAQLIAAAIKQSVKVLPADVNQSDWDCTVTTARTPVGVKGETAGVLRLGLQMIRGLSEPVGRRIVEERTGNGLFRSVEDLTRRVGLDRRSLDLLATADAFRELAGDRRAALWDALARHENDPLLPLFGEEAFQEKEETDRRPDALPKLTEQEEVYADYGSMGLSLRKHPMAFCRAELDGLGIAPAKTLASIPHGEIVRVAGLVIMRQRPSTAKGITFVTLEDETGSMNLILYPQVWTEFYAVAKTCSAWLVTGKLENREGVIHVLVRSLQDLAEHTHGLETRSRDFR